MTQGLNQGLLHCRQILHHLSHQGRIYTGICDILEKEMATHSSRLAWRIPRTEEPGRLQSMGSQRVRHDLMTKPPQCDILELQTLCHIFPFINSKGRPCFLKQNTAFTSKMLILPRPSFLTTYSLLKNWQIRSRSSRHNVFGF